ncbi:MAG: ATP-binding protein [Bdellovibrio sp. ArHS]|uniref:ABC transporter ATP-binding protein n=1 Tax=Bdellovibrio sp. ArHS TaxID=1569284 RepID=UPI000582AE52|nr:ABC transporter ATP-binding protein [Bdellovibrio sp. ArHS]KHD87508.1 MAG: ATP-binding protein [Bdellovibrio sp. ArHS]
MIECRGIIKEFGTPPQRILHDLSFSIADGEFVSISGRSGSGKSTLLYIISTLDSATRGQVLIDGRDVATLNVEQVHQFRNLHVGFVFQFHYLLPELTALENVLLPARNAGVMSEKRTMAESLLEELNVIKQKDKFPSQMSGGEQQRVAIARALIMQPRYIFADEPTGNLDTRNADIVMQILKRTNKELGTTICLVTHDPDFAAMAEREIYLIDGRLADRNREK